MNSITIEKLSYEDCSRRSILRNETFRFILSSFKEFYPDFESWYEKKVIEGLKTDHRAVYVLRNRNSIRGISILKKSRDVNKSSKICSFFVERGVRRNGVGRELMKLSLNEFEDEHINRNIVITIPEERITERIGGKSFLEFLQEYEFEAIEAKCGLYRPGKYEYVYSRRSTGNSSLMMRNILLSIKPKYLNEIIRGNKRFEFRKSVFSKPIGKVYIYASYPVSKIIGHFEAGETIKGKPEAIWSRCHRYAGVSKKEFLDYFGVTEMGSALEITGLELFKIPLDPRKFDPSFVAPQSYHYVKNGVAWLTALDGTLRSRDALQE